MELNLALLPDINVTVITVTAFNEFYQVDMGGKQH